MVEDSRKDAEKMKFYLERYEKENGLPIEISHFSDAIQFLTNYEPVYDLVLMDIEMPGINGMEAAQKLRQIDRTVVLIFVTNMVQFAINGYEVEALDFVVKPVTYFSFSMKLTRAVATVEMRRKTEGELLLPTSSGIKRQRISAIKYIEVIGHHLLFHTVDEEIDICGSLNDYEEKLCPAHFSRCNRCYLVNLRYVTNVDQNFVKVGGDKLLISVRRRKKFLDELTLYMGE